MRTKVKIAIIGVGLVVASAQAAPNSWTGGSDYWDISTNWSLGAAPSINDNAEFITNTTAKTVTIDSDDTAFFQLTLTISNLTLGGIGTTTNTLYLSNAGTAIPLRVLNALAVTNGGILQITNSFLRVDGLSGGLFKIDGTVRMTNGLMITTNALTVVGASGTGSLSIVGGTWQAGSVQLGGGAGSQATLTVARGAVSATNALGSGVVNVLGGTLTVNGGTNTFDALVLTNGTSSVMVFNGGRLQTKNTTVGIDSVEQFALGTNSSPVQVSSNLTLGGRLNVTDAGGFANGVYTLFTYGGSLTTNGSPTILTIGTVPNAGLTYAVDISSNGLVRLNVSGGAPSCTPPWANFSSTTTTGLAPLQVIFTDNSTGTIASVSWAFGDGNTTNFTAPTTAYTVTNTYNAGGTYTVTQTVASASCGISTNIQLNLINALTPGSWEAWQWQFFNCIGCAQAAGDADPLGKGMSNTNQFLAGLNPTNSASVFRIISAVRNTTDVAITWTTAGVRTNALQATTGDANGGYTNNFQDISGLIVINVSGDATTNYVEIGGATNTPSRYYRIRLVP